MNTNKMLETTHLQTPKSGRSRFSKALPAPPPSAENGPDSHLRPTHNHTSAPQYTHTHTLTQTHAPTHTYTHTQTRGPMTKTHLPAPPPTTGLPNLPFLKQLPPIDLGPPLPPPKEFEKGLFDEGPAMAAVKPLTSPLPPLPPKSGVLPSMSIPRRRPVGGSVQPQAQAQGPTVTLAPVPVPIPVPIPSPAPVLASAPSLAPSPPPDTAPEIISPNPLPSPVHSLSSLLSAYGTDHTSESTPRSSTNSTNDTPGTKDSYSNKSPGQTGPTSRSIEGQGLDSPTLPPGQNGQGLQYSGTNQESSPPPPPLKDHQQSDVQPSAGPQNASPAADSAPTEQLWRRRSLKSDKNLAVTELKLTSSHGSTAASGQASNSSQVAQPESFSSHQGQYQYSTQPAGPRVVLPRSSNAGLPGKNIRPVASRQQIEQPEGDNMGQIASKLKNHSGMAGRSNESNEKENGRREASPRPTPAATNVQKPLPSITTPSNVGRLPTPEYGHNESRGAIANTIVSPVSPASSPELPIDANPSVSPASPPATVDAGWGQKPEQPNLSVPQPPVGLPSSPADNRSQNQNGNPQFPSRTSSKSRGPHGSKQQEPPIRVVSQDELGTISENGSREKADTRDNNPDRGVSLDASLPEAQPNEDDIEETMTDHPGAALFPRDWFTPLPQDGIMDPQPLVDRHFRCITNHRYMTANRQRCNPIACGTCGQRNRTAEAYICSACHINICANCSGNLRRCRGNLKQLLEQIKNRDCAIDDDRTATITQANHGSEGSSMSGQPLEVANLAPSPSMQ